ncbi:hypothetical protein P3T22_005741 [Paraburkholderia sp. GAS348]
MADHNPNRGRPSGQNRNRYFDSQSDADVRRKLLAAHTPIGCLRML